MTRIIFTDDVIMFLKLHTKGIFNLFKSIRR